MNGEAPDQLAQSSYSLVVVYKVPIVCRRTAKILTRQHGCAVWSGSSLFAYVLRSLFSAADQYIDYNLATFLFALNIVWYCMSLCHCADTKNFAFLQGKYKQRYPENATITKHSFPRHKTNEKCGANNVKENVTYEIIAAQRKTCIRETGLERPVKKKKKYFGLWPVLLAQNLNPCPAEPGYALPLQTV